MTDDWDRRCLMNILNDFYAEQVLHSDHLYSENGIYHQLPDEIDVNVRSLRPSSLQTSRLDKHLNLRQLNVKCGGRTPRRRINIDWVGREDSYQVIYKTVAWNVIRVRFHQRTRLCSCWLTLQGSVAYIRSLPINDTPDIFGLHDNANITFAQNETNLLLTGLVNLQPKTTGGGGKSQEEVICFIELFFHYWLITGDI